MSLRDRFAELAATGSTRCLLGNCKLEWAGSEIYGEEAIAEAFRTSPFATEDRDLFVESPDHAAWFGGQSMLFADLYEGLIGRLWRLGPNTSNVAEPAVSVAFDPDLRQQRGSVYARREDHSFLEAEHFAAIKQAAETLLIAPLQSPQHRARAFLVRAFSSGEHAAALYAIHRLSGGEVRSSIFSYAAAAIGGDSSEIIFDQRPHLYWTPRI